MQIIFDLDGTLFQTRFSAINAIQYLCNELGLPQIDEGIIIQNIGKRTDDFLRSIFPSNINIDEIRQSFRDIEQREVVERGILFPKITEVLEQLTLQGHSLYICSNGSSEYIELVLKGTNIYKYFCEIYSAKYYDSKVEVVKTIIKDNRSTVVIGDTFSDIEAAMKNHIPSIGAVYGYGMKEDLKDATLIAENATDIISCVSQIEVFEQVTHRLIKNGKKIIGINGVDTSGKTVFTNQYSRFLDNIGIKNTVLHIDDFHNPSAIRYQGDNEIEAYYNHAFNYHQVIEEILKPLQEVGYLDKQVLCLNLDTDQYENVIHYKIDSDTILLIEGVLLFREPLLSYLEGKVFLHISFDEVLHRAKLRDVPKYGEGFLQKYCNKYIPIQKRYLSEEAPVQKSDFVINNEDYRNPKILDQHLT